MLGKIPYSGDDKALQMFLSALDVPSMEVLKAKLDVALISLVVV